MTIFENNLALSSEVEHMHMRVFIKAALFINSQRLETASNPSAICSSLILVCLCYGIMCSHETIAMVGVDFMNVMLSKKAKQNIKHLCCVILFMYSLKTGKIRWYCLGIKTIQNSKDRLPLGRERIITRKGLMREPGHGSICLLTECGYAEVCFTALLL